MIDLKTVVARLKENDFTYEIVDLAQDVQIIVSAYGGRIFGPFVGKGKSLCWINPCFGSAQAFKAFLNKKEWNLGGDRIWLAPEMQYNVPDKNDFWGSYTVPSQLDPGAYVLNRASETAVTLKQAMRLDVYDNKKKKKDLSISRTIAPIKMENSNIADGMCFGYDHEVHLAETENDGVLSEAWNLLQIKPHGTLYIPTTGPVEYSNYYDAIEAGYQQINDNHVALKIDGKKQFKVGYKALYTTGRSGYVSTYGDMHYLMVRSFYNDLTGPYVKSPTGQTADGGHALHIYNDDGNIGDFAEHECSCLPIGGGFDRSESIDKISTVFYLGSENTIKNMIKLFLGI